MHSRKRPATALLGALVGGMVGGMVGALAMAFALGAAAGTALAYDDDDDDDRHGARSRIKIDAPEGALRITGDRLVLKARQDELRHRGPGYRTSLIDGELRVDINDGRLGIRDDDDGDAPVTVDVFDLADFAAFPIVCGDTTYTFASGELIFTRRETSDRDRPAPFPPEIDDLFPVATLVGEIIGTAVNQDGEVFDVTGLDNADEVFDGDDFTSVTAVWLNFIDQDGVVVDRAALSGRFKADDTSSETVVVDHGNCGAEIVPGDIRVGPFFIYPFPPDRLIKIRGF